MIYTKEHLINMSKAGFGGIYPLPKPIKPMADDFLVTLAKWNELPQIIPLIDAANLIARLNRQESSAAMLLIGRAILSFKICCWVYLETGEWSEGIPLTSSCLEAEKIADLPDGGVKVQFTIDERPNFHTEVAGVNVREVFGFLVNSGVVVTDEFRSVAKLVVGGPEAAPAPAQPAPSAPAVAPPEPVAAPAEVVARPLQRQRHQEAEILRVLRELGHDPHALPRNTPGKAGPKAAAFGRLGWKKAERGVFDKAWDRLRQARDIADA